MFYIQHFSETNKYTTIIKKSEAIGSVLNNHPVRDAQIIIEVSLFLNGNSKAEHTRLLTLLLK
ncbi:Uncharacterised protein [uncultured archaeon]|nr:Uncharacterised protein [uncultured archaeon]